MNKLLPVCASVVALVAASPSLASTVSKTAFESGAIHDSGDNGSADYYGSGNDDNFGEYGIASFSFSASDFGLLSVPGIASVELTLTHNDRTFSDGDSVSFWYSPDDFDSSYTGLSYDDTGSSDPGGLDTTQFASIFSLGSYAYEPKDGGVEDVFALDFVGAALASLVSEVNAGSDFQLLIVADALAADVTFSGVGNTFDPGDPELAITAVPLPAGLPLLGFAVAALGVAARRK